MNKKLAAILSASLLVLVCAAFFLIKSAGATREPAEPDNGGNPNAGASEGRVCEMFLSDGTLYYTDHKVNLYKFDPSTGNGELMKKLKIAPSSQLLSDEGSLYYSDGSTIYKDTLGSTAAEKLASGKNLWMDAVGGGRLFYHTAYKDPSGGGYSEFDHHSVLLETGKDTLLFKRSEDMWHFRAVDGDTIIADAALADDSGLFAIDAGTGTCRKLSDLRPVDGCMVNGTYYFTTYDEIGLRALNLKSGALQQLTLPGMEAENFFVDRLVGFGDTLYAAAYYDNGNHLTRLDLKTGKTDLLAEVQGRVWKLCTDGNALYSYDTSSPADLKGNLIKLLLN